MYVVALVIQICYVKSQHDQFFVATRVILIGNSSIMLRQIHYQFELWGQNLYENLEFRYPTVRAKMNNY